MPHHLKRCALILLAATLLAQAAPAVHAQSAPPATPATQAADTAAKVPSFDVISIRPNKDNAQMSGNGSFRMRVGSRSLPDGYSASNIDLK